VYCEKNYDDGIELTKIHSPIQILYTGSTLELWCAGLASFRKGGVRWTSTRYRVDRFPGLKRATLLTKPNVHPSDGGYYTCKGEAQVFRGTESTLYSFNYSMEVYIGGKVARCVSLV